MATKKEVSEMSKQAMAQALVELMESQDFHSISIGEITAKAGLSRAAYYRNFNSKEAILAYWVNGMVGQYRDYADLPEGEAHHISHRNIKKVFLMFQEHECLVLACVDAGIAQCIPDALSKYMLSNFTNAAAEGPGGARRAYILEAYASAVFTTAVKWLRDGAKEAPEEMADIIYAVYGEHI